VIEIQDARSSANEALRAQFAAPQRGRGQVRRCLRQSVSDQSASDFSNAFQTTSAANGSPLGRLLSGVI
jgi:hypothetical protein